MIHCGWLNISPEERERPGRLASWIPGSEPLQGLEGSHKPDDLQLPQYTPHSNACVVGVLERLYNVFGCRLFFRLLKLFSRKFHDQESSQTFGFGVAKFTKPDA